MGTHGIGEKIIIQIELLRFKEDDTFIVYAPSLDLSGYGNTEEEASESFGIVLEEFCRYTLNKKTFFRELKKLGWEKIGTKKKPQYKPPYLDTLFGERDYLKEIIREKDYTKNTQQMPIPVL